jgi:hypothetical protein
MERSFATNIWLLKVLRFHSNLESLRFALRSFRTPVFGLRSPTSGRTLRFAPTRSPASHLRFPPIESGLPSALCSMLYTPVSGRTQDSPLHRLRFYRASSSSTRFPCASISSALPGSFVILKRATVSFSSFSFFMPASELSCSSSFLRILIFSAS